MPTIFRHYGHESFRRSRSTTEVETHPVMKMKPSYGLWASPVESDISWYRFCVDEHFHEDTLSKYFDFTLAEDAKIFQINSLVDLQLLLMNFPGEKIGSWKLIYQPPSSSNTLPWFPDYSKVAEEYDGVQVNISSDSSLYYWMYGWDVDSIVVWNKDVIVPIEVESQNVTS